MAACNTPSSSLMLSYAATTTHQDLTPSIVSFKSNKPTFSLYPLVLKISRDRKFGLKWANSCSQRVSKHVVVAAVAAETEVAEAAEAVEEKEGVAEGAAGTATAPPKPKKGKAALPLKRDRGEAVLERECSGESESARAMAKSSLVPLAQPELRGACLTALCSLLCLSWQGK